MDKKEELREKLIQMLISHECLYKDYQMELDIVLSDYEIDGRKTELVVINEDEDQRLIRKFFTAKIVGGRTERTLEFYRECIERFFRMTQKSVKDITADDIRLYLAIRMKRDGVSEVTVGNELRSLSSFYNFLYREEVIRTNPIAKVENIKASKVKKNAFTEYDLELIRNACACNMERAITEMLISTGCRVGELVLMKRSELKGNSIIVHGKGKKDRTVYLNAKAQLALQNYLNQRKDVVDWLFPGSVSLMELHKLKSGEKGKYKIEWYKYPQLVVDKPIDIGTVEQKVRKIGRIAGVEKTHPHRFRRTCATMALRHGMPIEQVSKMLGHENVATTQIYLDLSEEDLAQAHKKYVV